MTPDAALAALHVADLDVVDAALTWAARETPATTERLRVAVAGHEVAAQRFAATLRPPVAPVPDRRAAWEAIR